MKQSKPLEDRYDGCGIIARAREADKLLDPGQQPRHDGINNCTPINRLIAIGVAAAREIDVRRKIFQRTCNLRSNDKLGVKVFDEMDAYELDGLPWMEVSPSEFLRQRFGKDFDRLAVEHEQRTSAVQEEEADDGR